MLWMFPTPPAQPLTPCNLLHQPLSLFGEPHVLLLPHTASSTLDAVLPLHYLFIFLSLPTLKLSNIPSVLASKQAFTCLALTEILIL